MIKFLNGDDCHAALTAQNVGELAFSPEADFGVWRLQLREKLSQLLGMERIAANACIPKVEIEEETELEGYRRIRFTVETERDCQVPCYLLIPSGGEGPFPVAITLQGHSSGFHNSVGIVKFDGDAAYQTRGTFAIQAVEHGFAALCIELRGMGELRSPRCLLGSHSCAFNAMTALNHGRTMLGERVWDISRVIDVLPQLGMDTGRILITGNSGGGTASFYAACMDERIALSVPSCSFCSYKASIMSLVHCVCNYIPQASCYFEMEDLSALIAPRRLTVVTGQKDDIFPIEGVRESYRTVEKIYAAAGVPENCRLVETPREHWWCQDLVWGSIEETVREMGWR